MVAALISAVLALPAPALPAAWSHWKYQRFVAAGPRGTHTFVVPPSVYAKAQPSLADLRIVTAAGLPVPFAIETPLPHAPEVWKDARLLDVGFVPGRFSQAVADFGSRRNEYTIVDIATPRTNFSVRADIDASDDGKTWRIVRTSAPLYDYRRDGLPSNTRISLPAGTARFIRVRVLDPAQPFGIDGVRAGLAGTAPDSSRYALRLETAQRRSGERDTTIVLGGIANVPVSQLRIDARNPRFARTVDVQIAGDTGEWRTVAVGSISRITRGHEALSLDFDETQAARWRVVVHDGDDPPLEGVSVSAAGSPRRVAFDAAARQPYVLLYGNPAAAEPTFDYAQTHPRAAVARAYRVALLDPVRTGTDTNDDAPWTERHPWILRIALGIAVLGVGAFALRTLATRPSL